MKDRIRLISLTVIAFGSIGWSEIAPAGIVYQQAPQYPSMTSAWSSSYDPSTGGYGSIYTTYDNFSVGRTASVNSVSWQGFSFNSNTLGATNIPVTAFNIAFYADVSGAPAPTALFSETITSGISQQVAGPINLFNNGQTETVYNDSTALATAFTVMAGTTYWLSIQAVTDYPAIWTWTSGTGGDGTSYQVVSPAFGGGSYVRPGDRTFTLAFVPTPPSLVLCGIAALIGLGAMRLRPGRRAAGPRPDPIA